jgi:hypothetical protein
MTLRPNQDPDLYASDIIASRLMSCAVITDDLRSTVFGDRLNRVFRGPSSNMSARTVPTRMLAPCPAPPLAVAPCVFGRYQHDGRTR